MHYENNLIIKNPGKNVNSVAHSYLQRKEVVSIDILFTYTQIGSTESNPVVSYPVSASIVKYLITEYGIDKFIKAFTLLKNSEDPKIISDNRKKFKQIYSKSVSDIEKDWIKALDSEFE